MPIPPPQDPPLTSFGALISLDELPKEELRGGPAPWARASPPLRDLRTQSSPLWFGGGVFGHGMYNDDSVLTSNAAVRALRLAFRYGINALDSSPYYFPSELVLGRALRILAPEHPRDSYFLVTKCGRYGPLRSQFDYSPERIRSSIEQSLQRLGTTYLDGALLHDAEFVSDQPEIALTNEGRWLAASAVGLSDTYTPEEARRLLGIAPEEAARIRGPGDEAVLQAARTLFELKDAGIVRNVGLSGYPLGELVRLSRLIATHAPYRSLDMILSYSNHTLHADLLPAWKSLFDASPTDAPWTPPMLLNASPFSMGLLSDRGPPAWHPADAPLRHATKQALSEIQQEAAAHPASFMPANQALATTALFRGLRGSDIVNEDGVPYLRTLLGMSNTDEVHTAMSTYRVLTARDDPAQAQLATYEARVRQRIVEAGAADQTWASPPADA
ncbi:D-arabinose 1-dehydrogenase (NAD(+)) [Malassezia equina]|uniref:D-arabinose 1-dehydrogenase (NAD(+)) n=1 Tax=Malassezia equina TaxID=1381935 RepID=A0AAF0J4N9_9BASI|nr:D-arabinose 1-dehydrogenase (NAD(+)) [Malassezia equina]